MSEWDSLRHWLREAAGGTLSDAQVARLRAYADVLLLWNRKIALISQRDTHRIVSHHIADSLFVAMRCRDGESIVDLGSGAGFPGLPIAVVRPASRVCLIESNAKKTSFLAEALRLTASANASVCHARIEATARDERHRHQYDVAVARALTETGALVRAAQPFLAADGRVLAMKSRAQAEGAAVTVSYRLPDGTPRVLLEFARINSPVPPP